MTYDPPMTSKPFGHLASTTATAPGAIPPSVSLTCTTVAFHLSGFFGFFAALAEAGSAHATSASEATAILARPMATTLHRQVGSRA